MGVEFLGGLEVLGFFCLADAYVRESVGDDDAT
jgi:hypothetical protein